MGLSSSPKFPHDDNDDRTLLLPGRSSPGIHDVSRAPSVELSDLQPSSENHAPDQGDADALGEAQKLAQDVRIALSQLKDDLGAEREREKKEMLKKDARDRRLRSRWFP